jgi:hypothetical protein
MSDVEVAYLVDPDSRLFASRSAVVEQLAGNTPTCVQDFRRVLDDETLNAVSILRASLTKESGGYEWCRTEDGQPTAAFRDTNDADYKAILQAIQAAKVRQEQYGRPDIRGFRPGDYYVRWMKRFGILPEDFDLAKEVLDPHETDQAYWRSLWHRPAAVRSASMAGQGR